MSKLNRLASVAHNIGHHASSGLAWLYPHLWDVCQTVETRDATVSLLSAKPYPDGRAHHEYLANALGALHETFCRMLAAEDWTLDELTAATVHFTFPSNPTDGSDYAVEVILTARGRTLRSVQPRWSTRL
jgi:hypothetical protein